MASFEFEGRTIPVAEGDTVASALYRAGVRTFSRSFKYHRRRGLYCLSGDCPNCLVSVNGMPGVRSCIEPARDGLIVRREAGWPSAEFDLLAIADRLHALMPVGFYYKTFIRPRFAWPLAERVIRRVTGLGRLPVEQAPTVKGSRNARCDLLVIGGGVAGLAAAHEAAGRGDSVILCDEGRLGEKLAPGTAAQRVATLAEALRDSTPVEILERHAAVGIYDGLLVPLAGDEELVRVRPDRVVVATGAVEAHGVFHGNDVPGVFLGRGAQRLGAVHGVVPGERAVVAVETAEGWDQVRTLDGLGVEVVAVVTRGGVSRRAALPAGSEVIAGAIDRVVGREQVRAAMVRTKDGRRRRIACDTVVLSLGYAPRDELLRMAAPGERVLGAGEVVAPGCSVEEAEASGRAAAGERATETRGGDPLAGRDGIVCLCEDVSVEDLRRAWAEGWRSSEILKRYTTATMGPCRGVMCGRYLARFAAEQGARRPATGRTTARPPARPVALETLAAPVHEIVERRTALHDAHVALGGRLGWSGSWIRPFHYGDPEEEYRAVRERVGVMDVGTLGKFLVGGEDVEELLDRVFPTRIRDLLPGRARYVLSLSEGGYVIDDGMVAALGAGGYYLSSTSGGADAMEAWLKNWADRFGLRAHVVNMTSVNGAVLVAGPRSRELLAQLSGDDLSAEAIPYPGHAEIVVAGVPCWALRVGFVGELGFELHHPARRGEELWSALLREGREFGIRPLGLDTLEVLRLEKGHVYLGQDTLPDDHPGKLGLLWAVDMEKPRFIGKPALERMLALPPSRRLAALAFDTERIDPVALRGEPLWDGDRLAGRVTSAAASPATGRAIGLGWITAEGGRFPEWLTAAGVGVEIVEPPFYDPEGVRLRA